MGRGVENEAGSLHNPSPFNGDREAAGRLVRVMPVCGAGWTRHGGAPER